MTVNALRSAGFEVRVKHFRFVDGSDGLADISPRGGSTTVDLRLPNVDLATTGRANCSFNDNFVKREGVRIAARRALRDLAPSLINLGWEAEKINQLFGVI